MVAVGDALCFTAYTVTHTTTIAPVMTTYTETVPKPIHVDCGDCQLVTEQVTTTIGKLPPGRKVKWVTANGAKTIDAPMCRPSGCTTKMWVTVTTTIAPTVTVPGKTATVGKQVGCGTCKLKLQTMTMRISKVGYAPKSGQDVKTVTAKNSTKTTYTPLCAATLESKPEPEKERS